MLAATSVTSVRGKRSGGTGAGVGAKVERRTGENNVARGNEVASEAAMVVWLAGSCGCRRQAAVRREQRMWEEKKSTLRAGGGTSGCERVGYYLL